MDVANLNPMIAPNSGGNVIPNEPGSNVIYIVVVLVICLLYTSPSPRDRSLSRMPSSA